eukprot:TRINITY_DN633_c2_g1_i1.p1 TRINITY_DN633_c2_g1~~TRINITY_DN633_c2_g1_i1.p1  ORF type:complete len:126 (-),score=27.58 TRINITY_DN633_c2_g1_i1:47-403(-)
MNATQKSALEYLNSLSRISRAFFSPLGAEKFSEIKDTKKAFSDAANSLSENLAELGIIWSENSEKSAPAFVEPKITKNRDPESAILRRKIAEKDAELAKISRELRDLQMAISAMKAEN